LAHNLLPQFFPSNGESMVENVGMHRSGKSIRWGVALATLTLVATAALWRRSEPPVAKDYETCVEEAQSKSSSSVEYSKLVTHCGEQFAGRRKAGGGYTYFDFMQNRTFDIAGPNPTEDERKHIDRTYMEFLGAQRKEMITSILAKALADQELVSPTRRDVGPPLILTPKIPLPAKRPSAERSKSCEDGSLSCSWARLSAVVRNALASSTATNR
jgi:hypothetical protein